MESQPSDEAVEKCDKSTWTHEHGSLPCRKKSSPKLRLKPICQPPRNISPIPEGSKSNESSLQRQSSVVSDSEAVGGGHFRAGLMVVIFSIHWFASAAVFFIGLFLTLVPPSQEHAGQLYFVMVYLRSGYWIATYVQHERIKPACQRLINENYNLYRDMTCYRKAPLHIVSIWNMVLLAVQSYVQTLLLAQENGPDFYPETGAEDDPFKLRTISPQMFIVLFCGLETIALGCFYLPAIMRLIRSTLPHQAEEETPNQTLSNLDDIPVNQRLKRQAEQVKLLRVAYLKLKREAASLGALD